MLDAAYRYLGFPTISITSTTARVRHYASVMIRFRQCAFRHADAVWLYHRFPLSLREVEEMMMACGDPPLTTDSARRERVRFSSCA